MVEDNQEWRSSWKSGYISHNALESEHSKRCYTKVNKDAKFSDRSLKHIEDMAGSSYIMVDHNIIMSSIELK